MILLIEEQNYQSLNVETPKKIVFSFSLGILWHILLWQIKRDEFCNIHLLDLAIYCFMGTWFDMKCTKWDLMPLVTARFVTRFNLWLRLDLWPHNASICDPARFVTKSASICDQRYTMILESKLCRGKLVFVFTLIMYAKWYHMIIYIWIML